MKRQHLWVVAIWLALPLALVSACRGSRQQTPAAAGPSSSPTAQETPAAPQGAQQAPDSLQPGTSQPATPGPSPTVSPAPTRRGTPLPI